MSTTAPVKKVRKKIDKSNWECSCGQSLRLRKLADFEKFCPKCFKEFPLGRKDKSKVTGVALRRDKPSASSAMESKSGSCSKGGPHEVRKDNHGVLCLFSLLSVFLEIFVSFAASFYRYLHCMRIPRSTDLLPFTNSRLLLPTL